MNPLDKEVAEFMKSNGFVETEDDSNSRWVLNAGPIWPRVQCNQVTATFFYIATKQAELKGHKDEVQYLLDNSADRYWSVGVISYLNDVRLDELEAQLNNSNKEN